MRDDRRLRVSDEVARLVSAIASVYSPLTALDPSCTDVSMLARCDFVPSRKAFFRNDDDFKSAATEGTGIDCHVYDITDEPSPEKADLVVTLLPFRAMDRSGDRVRRLDLLIAERSLPMICKSGVGLFITTPNYLTMPLYSRFRNNILHTMSLDAVIELPRGSIENAGNPTVLLVVRNGATHVHGTFLGEYTSHNPHDIVAAIREGHGDFFVPTESLRERWDRHYHDPRHQTLEKGLSAMETRPITAFGEIYRGRPELRTHESDSGEYWVLSNSDVREGKIISRERRKYVNEVSEKWFDDIVLRPGDVVISLLRPAAYVYQESDPPAVISQNMAVLSTEDNDYVATYLNTPEGRRLFASQANRLSRGVMMPSLSIRDLSSIHVPILPLEKLNAVGDRHIETATSTELESLRTALLRVKHQLEYKEAELERERRRSQKLQSDRQFLDDRLGRIESKLDVANRKLDDIASRLATVVTEIGTVKHSSREEEEKLAQIGAKLDRFVETSSVEQQTFRQFVCIVESWLLDWDRLDPLTQQFLPSAEQIYDLLVKNKDCDFSPFIVQYCRSLENELLTKLFIAYHEDLATRQSERAELTASAMDNDKTQRFAKNVENNRKRYTLGEMSFIMSLIVPGGKTLADIPLLQDFQRFVNTFFDERIAEKAFLNRIRDINEKFRIKAAHPYLMTKADADQCKTEIRAALLDLLDACRGGEDG